MHHLVVVWLSQLAYVHTYMYGIKIIFIKINTYFYISIVQLFQSAKVISCTAIYAYLVYTHKHINTYTHSMRWITY